MISRAIYDDLIEVVAKQLYAFDNLCGPTETLSDYVKRISDEKVIERYRNDPVFRNKVVAMVASVAPPVSNPRATTPTPSQIQQAIEHLEKEGWKVVPKEPDDTMVRAGMCYALTVETYRAMLAAAPVYAASPVGEKEGNA